MSEIETIDDVLKKVKEEFKERNPEVETLNEINGHRLDGANYAVGLFRESLSSLESQIEGLRELLKESYSCLGSYESGLRFSEMEEDVEYVSVLREKIQESIKEKTS